MADPPPNGFVRAVSKAPLIVIRLAHLTKARLALWRKFLMMTRAADRIRMAFQSVFQPMFPYSPARHLETPGRFLSPLVAFVASGFGLPLGAIDFEKDILPIFSQHCSECHGAEMTKPKAGFVFDTVESLAKHINPDQSKGFFVPGKPEASDMMTILTMPADEREAMPPSGNARVSPEQIKLIRDWITAGAALTPEEAIAFQAKQGEKMNEVREKFWDWTNVEGKTISARFIRRDGSKVVLQMTADGPEVEYPMNKLSQDSKLQAFRLGQMMKE